MSLLVIPPQQVAIQETTSGTTPLGCLQARCHDFAGYCSGSRKQSSRSTRPDRVPAASLKGHRVGQWSGRVTGNWRVVFRFEDNEAVEVDFDF